MPTQRRQTWRHGVMAALDEVDAFVSARQLHTRLRESGDRVSLTTVYRALRRLAEDGEVDVLWTAENESMYRRCGSGQHHHLVCRYCWCTVEVESAEVERWARRLGHDNGFEDIEHVIEIFGTCVRCAPTVGRRPL